MIDQGQLSLLIPEKEIRARVSSLARQINADYADRGEVAVIGVLRGGFVFLADLIRQLSLDVSLDFIWIASYGAGTSPDGPVRLVHDVEADLTGRDVVIVEDVVDSGESLAFLRGHVASKGAASVRVCVLLDKRGRAAEGGLEYVGFQIESQFVVGYGLDLDQRFRQLPDIYRLGEVETDGR